MALAVPCHHHHGLWVLAGERDGLQRVKPAQNRAWRRIFSAQPCVTEGPMTGGLYLEGLPAPRRQVCLSACPSVHLSATLGCGRCLPRLPAVVLGLLLAFACLYSFILQEPRPLGSSTLCTARAPQLALGSRHGGPGRGFPGPLPGSSTPVLWVPQGTPTLADGVRSQQRWWDYKWRGGFRFQCAFHCRIRCVMGRVGGGFWIPAPLPLGLSCTTAPLAPALGGAG